MQVGELNPDAILHPEPPDDGRTMQYDASEDIVRMVVGLAASKPAEFVIIQIALKAA